MNNTTAQLHNATINIKASRYDSFLHLPIDIMIHKGGSLSAWNLRPNADLQNAW